MGNKSISKQLFSLMRNITSLSNGQASVSDYADCMTEMTIIISPNDGLYQGGRFKFKIEFDERYPVSPPTVSCETMIYHPNIDAYDGNYFDNVCVNILNDWDSKTDLESLVQGILYLFYHPNLDDPLSIMFGSYMTSDEYSLRVKKSLHGGVVDGFYFERNIVSQQADETREIQNPDMTSRVSELGEQFSDVVKVSQEPLNDDGAILETKPATPNLGVDETVACCQELGGEATPTCCWSCRPERCCGVRCRGRGRKTRGRLPLKRFVRVCFRTFNFTAQRKVVKL
ncbi:uncharacterized protein LOC144359201 [Saccoglossus kowalevskii]